MSQSFDSIIIGVGAMGAATCFELARRGVRVLGLEQFDIPHARGSSHGFSRMIRMAYYEHADYVPLLRRAYQRWSELETLCGRKLMHITGGTYIGANGSKLIEGSLRSARQHALEHERLDHRQLSQRFGQFQLPENYVGLHEPTAGWLEPERCICAFVDQALQRGAEIRGHEPVRTWSANSGGVQVITDRAAYHAERVIVCGGAWAAKLLAEVELRLTVTRQTMMWLWPRRPELFDPQRFGVWAVGHDDGSLHYGFPMAGDGVGLKIAHHARGPVTDPDHVSRDPRPGDEDSVRSFIRQFMPAADGPTLAHRVCLYTNTPDSHFIVDRHPQHERVTLACGFSGHGFKFASVIGEALADLAMSGSSSLPIGFLSLNRFSPDAAKNHAR